MLRILTDSPRRTVRLLLRACSAGLGWLLFFSCRPFDPIVQPLYGVAEYGMPYARFQVLGTIRAQDTGDPIPGIRVSVSDTGSTVPHDTAYSDSAGRYLLEFSDPPWTGVWRLSVRDVDGADNGVFLPRDTTVSIPESSLTGGDGSWNAGTGKDTMDVDLQPGPV